jgi:hypothetical protein
VTPIVGKQLSGVISIHLPMPHSGRSTPLQIATPLDLASWLRCFVTATGWYVGVLRKFQISRRPADTIRARQLRRFEETTRLKLTGEDRVFLPAPEWTMSTFQFAARKQRAPSKPQDHAGSIRRDRSGNGPFDFQHAIPSSPIPPRPVP